MSKETFTTREAAEKLGVSSARVRQMILEGDLPAEKFGHILVIHAAALEAAKHRKTSPGPAPKPKTNGAAPLKRAKKGGRK
ncbi:MAG: DNA-binding protein [Acidobacteria bacterium]|nr:MAG: DNA-binding protein [Acidobacteriota bacterium]PYS81268.1 MAG: DNA-binding protein [Acidobacteriota bacterium]